MHEATRFEALALIARLFRSHHSRLRRLEDPNGTHENVREDTDGSQESELENLRGDVAVILRYFRFDHLPPHLRAVSEPFARLAHEIAERPARDPAEALAALRKLLEAKDCAVRSILPP